MADFPDPKDPLADARNLFRAFYSTASGDDAVLMDRLLCVHAAVTLAIDYPHMPGDPLRGELEKVTDTTERAFTELREAVRSCRTFRRLCEGDQRRIENVLFELFPAFEE